MAYQIILSWSVSSLNSVISCLVRYQILKVIQILSKHYVLPNSTCNYCLLCVGYFRHVDSVLQTSDMFEVPIEVSTMITGGAK